jgi:hypothetical protein
MVCMHGYFEWLFRVVVSHGLVGVHGLARWFICLVTSSGCFLWLFHMVGVGSDLVAMPFEST